MVLFKLEVEEMKRYTRKRLVQLFQLSEVYNKISQNDIIFTVVHCNVKYFNVMYQKVILMNLRLYYYSFIVNNLIR